jgi:hypothetical protein
MKIIKIGDPIRGREYKHECFHCGTIFTFFKDETKEESLSALTPPDSRLTYQTVICPVCNKKLYLT